MVTAVQSNGPAGGSAGTQPVPPTMTPADVAALVEQLTPLQQRFRQQSSPLSVPLNRQTLILGEPDTAQIKSVGLGTHLVSHWHVEITVANAATSAETFSISPLFPYNMIQRISANINGGSAVYNASGLGTLHVMTRQRRTSRQLTNLGGFGPALNPALVRVTFGSNLTPTNAGNTDRYLSGVKSVSVAGSASTNNKITVDFYTVEKFALDRDSLLGALPLQNNATYAELQRQLVGSLSGTRGDLSKPFYTAGADLTFALATGYCDATYNFWSVPSDPALYQAMVSNSYQVQEVSSISTAETGPEAFTYNIPSNMYLVAMGLWSQDGNGAVIDESLFTKRVLQYNGGSVTPVTQYQSRERAHQFLAYGYDPSYFPGLVFWDGEDTSDDINATDNAGWLNCYSAATPQWVIDLDSTITTTVKSALVREQIVVGAARTIGG